MWGHWWGGTDYSKENCKGVLLNVTSVSDTINSGCQIDVQAFHLIGLHNCDWSIPGEKRKSMVLRSWNDKSLQYNVIDAVNKWRFGRIKPLESLIMTGPEAWANTRREL